LFVAIAAASLNANTTSTVVEVGVGCCFAVWQFVYHGALGNGASTGEALDLAGIAFNQCVAEND